MASSSIEVMGEDMQMMLMEHEVPASQLEEEHDAGSAMIDNGMVRA